MLNYCYIATLDKNTWNHLTVFKKSLGLIKNVIFEMYLQILYIYIFNIYV